MKIAVTGARGTVGQEVVQLCSKEGHHTVQRTQASDYEAAIKAFAGCDAVIHPAAIPNPVGTDDFKVHANYVNSASIGFRACGELGIKKICYASSVNAIGLAYANQPLKFPYCPIDEDYPRNPTDSYALAKLEAKAQGRALVNWFPGTKIAMLRIHEVAPKADVLKEHKEDWANAAVKQLWGWVSPKATARACSLAVTANNKFEGCEVFNVIASTTTQDTPSEELAKKYFPEAKLKSDMSTNRSFWTYDKIEKVLGWKHEETE